MREVEQEEERGGRRGDNGEETKMRGEAEIEGEAGRGGGIGFFTNKSIQRSRKVAMRKGERGRHDERVKSSQE